MKNEAENAKNHWTATAVVTDKVLSNEIRNVEHARVSQLNSMKNSHFVDMSVRARDTQELSRVLGHKDFEAQKLSIDNQHLNSGLKEASLERERNLHDSLFWRQQAQISERDRLINLQRNEALRRDAVN